jgi:hypothetical protein
MNFAVYQDLESFVGILKAGNVVYLTAYSQGGEAPTSYLLITTDAGVEGGTVHAMLIRVLEKPDDITAAVFAGNAFKKMQLFLSGAGIKVIEGFVATAGLEESLNTWRHAGGLSLENLTKILERLQKQKPRAKALNERRRNQINK